MTNHATNGEPLEACRAKAFDLSACDKIGNVVTRACDLMQSIANKGEVGEYVEYLMKSLEMERQMVLTHDKKSENSLRVLVYSFCVGLENTMKMIINQRKEDESFNKSSDFPAEKSTVHQAPKRRTRKPLPIGQPKPNRSATRRRNILFLQKTAAGNGADNQIILPRQRVMRVMPIMPDDDAGDARSNDYYVVSTVIDHLKNAHNTNPIKERIFFRCDCGAEVQRGHKCDQTNFTLIRKKILEEKIVDSDDVQSNESESASEPCDAIAADRKSSIAERFNSSTLKCHKCNMIYLNEQKYRLHMKTLCHTRCVKCPAVFRSREAIRQHMLLKHGSAASRAAAHAALGQHECSECGSRFKTPATLKTHMKVHQEPDFTCEKCGQTFTRENHFLHHINKFHGTKKLECAICKKKFGQRNELKIHESVHYVEVKSEDVEGESENRIVKTEPIDDSLQKEMKCPLCESGFYNVGSFITHLAKIHNTLPSKEGIYIRCNCGSELQSGSHKCDRMNFTIVRKMIVKEEKEDDDALPESNQTAAPAKSQIRTRVKPVAFKCDKCDAHPDTLHTRCAECLVVFKSLMAQKQHMLLHHGNAATAAAAAAAMGAFECDECGAKFKTAGTLRMHMPQHGDRPFSCEHCDHRFATTEGLRSHKRDVHSMKTLECKICKQKFNRSEELKMHLATHYVEV